MPNTPPVSPKARRKESQSAASNDASQGDIGGDNVSPENTSGIDTVDVIPKKNGGASDSVEGGQGSGCKTGRKESIEQYKPSKSKGLAGLLSCFGSRTEK